MKDVSLKQLVSDVAALLGESTVLECSPEESPFPDLEDRVRILAPGILSELLRELPVEEISDIRRFPSEISIDREGCVTLPCPEDFLRLSYVKMSDWRYGVRHVSRDDSRESRCQHSMHVGVRGSRDRPVVTAGIDSSGCRCLKMFSSDENATLEQAFYVPVPVISADDTLQIPDILYIRLLRGIVRDIISDIMK